MREIFWILLMALPILYLVSLHSSIGDYYPSVDVKVVWDSMNQNVFKIIIYESSYILQFISTEFFFRGIFVIILAKWMGCRVIMPMAVLYAVWHFGKPVPEIMTSYFGGYILGIISLKTKSILIPILLHIGIAMFIEGFSIINKLFIL
jgi:membrane protease YdiL (CAAX protease family)